MNDIRLGEILAETGTITRRQLEQALAYQKEHGGLRIGQALTALGFATQRQVLQALARRLDLPLADLSQQTAEREALELVPQALAVRYHVLPLRCRGGVLSLAADDPLNYYAFEDLRQLTGLELDIQLAEPEPLLKAVQYYYADLGARRAARTADAQPGGGAVPPPGPAAVDVRAAEDGAPAVRLLNNLLQRAITAGASDIHLEPFEDRTGVRMRIDGALIEYMQLPRALHQPLIARIKILAGLDIAEHRLPQDGHFRAHSEEGGGVNLRVSVMPTVFGEKAVLRLLADSAAIDHAGHFGMRDAVYARFAPLLQRPNGIIYLTGPTGSGKTTTLYLILEALRRRSVNIVTIEDPVERNIDRISQTQINPVAGLTFESGLRALLRQDPDSSWSAKRGTLRPPPSRCGRPSPGIWSFPRCTQTMRSVRSRAWPIWALNRIWRPTRWPGLWPSACCAKSAPTAGRKNPSRRRRPLCSARRCARCAAAAAARTATGPATAAAWPSMSLSRWTKRCAA